MKIRDNIIEAGAGHKNVETVPLGLDDTMAGQDGETRTDSPAGDDDGFPQYPRQEVPGPPSIISSRMTDIASDDGEEDSDPQAGTASHRRSGIASASDAPSRPGTARTGWSQSQPLRRGLSGKRKSIAGSATGSGAGTRPPSATSRNHVPSLTSHAFFRPMSSQKLQAQRGASRPTTLTRPLVAGDDQGPESGANTARQSIISNPVSRLARQLTDEGEMRPPSPGTEVTEQETVDRITANTSPTQGHYATASLSESVRPLQKKTAENKGLSVNTNRSYLNGGNQQTPLKSPRSFRSSFLLPTRNESSQNGSNRRMQGGEKLDSVASSPQLTPADLNAKQKLPKANKKLGYNFEYFEGNTVFCMGGRLQNARHRPVNIATGAVIVIPAGLFFGFSAPYLWTNISPAIPIVFAYMFYICMSSFLHASVSDPGVCHSPLLRGTHVKLTNVADYAQEPSPIPTTGRERGPLEIRAPGQRLDLGQVG